MNIFGAITIIVALFSTFLGGICCALLMSRFSPAAVWPASILVGLGSGYLSLKIYFWCLNKLAESAKVKKAKKESL
jgi:hypothetical protein